jgi:hypothetical protein
VGRTQSCTKCAKATRYADLRGFFFDYLGGPLDDDAVVGDAAYDSDLTQLANAVTGSSLDSSGEDITKVGSNDNNMNGTGETFDAGLLFGGSGGMTAQGTNDDVQLIEFTISGLTLDEIDGQCFGIRALSVGETEEYRTDSVKLLGTFDVTDDGGILS